MHRLVRWFVGVGLILAMAGCKTPEHVAAGAAHSASVLDRIFASGILRVGMSGDQPPFNMTTRSGQLIGIEPDLANALASRMGVRAEFIKKPFGQLLGALEAGEVDMVLSQVTMTTARNTRVAFAGPYFVSGQAILTKSKNLAQADDTGDLNMTGIRLSALSGSTSEAFIQQAIPSARLVPTQTPQLAIQAVINGKVDAMVADLSLCVVAVLRHPEADLTTLASPLTFEPIGAALPASDPLFLNLVQNYISVLEGTGAMGRLEKQWFESDAWLKELP